MTIFTEAIANLIDYTDESFEDTPASTVIGYTAATMAIAYFGAQFLKNQLYRRLIGNSTKACVKRNLRKLPPVRDELQKELANLQKDLEEKFLRA